MGRAKLTGQVLDERYRVIEPIGEGAMGSVFRGERIKLGRMVAIKVLNENIPNADSRRRFEREAMAMAKLEHPNCGTVLDVGVHDDRPYVVMEFVSGQNLKELINTGPLPVARAVEITRQVLSGLSHAHEHGIIHRDIKPANIIVSQKAGVGDHAKILDFGIARTTQDTSNLTGGLVLGTPNYMAPEQIRGGKIDHRVDLYACGITLFELLTGTKPFQAEDPMAVCMQHLEFAPPRLADKAPGRTFGALEDVVARALAKDPAQRFASADEFARALVAAANQLSAQPQAKKSSQAKSPPAKSPAVPPAKSHAAPPAKAAPTKSPPAKSAPSGVSTVAAIPSAVARPRRRALAIAGAGLVAAAVAVGIGIVVTRPDAQSSAATKAGESSAATEAGESSATKAGESSVATKAGQPSTPASPRASASAKAPPPPAERDKPATARSGDPVDELIARALETADAGRREAAIDLLQKARKAYPTNARIPYEASKLVLGKSWWADGLKLARAAIALDPSYRSDADLIKLVLKGFNSTASYDWMLAKFLREDIGAPAKPFLEDTAASHPNLIVRKRAAAELKRYK